ncbi:hypothetical protein Bca52824_033331 [Brassica carinata]|uniref:Uncharacterized protein n=1 Tax=Brassica carinata TaxID=52824 RepID=A0A8X7V5Y7_BRACI|nr:hypothetical protein Bca52824_033331 [Brassica carinata]
MIAFRPIQANESNKFKSTQLDWCSSSVSTALAGFSRIQGVSIWDLALVLHSILALVSDSSSSTSSVRRFSATSSVWWFSCLWPPLQTFGLRSHPSTTWGLLELLWWCAWQLCAGWAQFMEYGGCSPFARFGILCRSFPGLINARSGC